jgi:hypothetical protein
MCRSILYHNRKRASMHIIQIYATCVTPLNIAEIVSVPCMSCSFYACQGNMHSILCGFTLQRIISYAVPQPWLGWQLAIQTMRLHLRRSKPAYTGPVLRQHCCTSGAAHCWLSWQQPCGEGCTTPMRTASCVLLPVPSAALLAGLQRSSVHCTAISTQLGPGRPCISSYCSTAAAGEAVAAPIVGGSRTTHTACSCYQQSTLANAATPADRRLEAFGGCASSIVGSWRRSRTVAAAAPLPAELVAVGTRLVPAAAPRAATDRACPVALPAHIIREVRSSAGCVVLNGACHVALHL